jgi:hypothetical protein
MQRMVCGVDLYAERIGRVLYAVCAMRRILFWGCVFGLLAFLPQNNVTAEPPASGEMVEVPKAVAEGQLAKYRTSLSRVAELEAKLRQMEGRAESCAASFGEMHRPGPV